MLPKAASLVDGRALRSEPLSESPWEGPPTGQVPEVHVASSEVVGGGAGVARRGGGGVGGGADLRGCDGDGVGGAGCPGEGLCGGVLRAVDGEGRARRGGADGDLDGGGAGGEERTKGKNGKRK